MYVLSSPFLHPGGWFFAIVIRKEEGEKMEEQKGWGEDKVWKSVLPFDFVSLRFIQTPVHACAKRRQSRVSRSLTQCD